MVLTPHTSLISLQVEGIQVHADEGGTTQTRGGVYWLILPAGCINCHYSCFSYLVMLPFKIVKDVLINNIFCS
jgi:hypothetical protein